MPKPPRAAVVDFKPMADARAASTAAPAERSAPPMMVVPFTFATARATALVPFANASISKTPIGPFQITVLASASSPW